MVLIKLVDPLAQAIETSEAEELAAYRAGFGLLRRLHGSPKLRGIPVIIHAALRREDVASELQSMPENIVFVHKSQTSDDLLRKIRALVVDSGGQLARPTRRVRKRLIDATK